MKEYRILRTAGVYIPQVNVAGSWVDIDVCLRRFSAKRAIRKHKKIPVVVWSSEGIKTF